MPNWGSILGGIGAITAAPFTGGSSLALMGSLLGGASGILGGLAGGRAQGRQAEANQQLSQDEIRQRLWEAQTARLLDRQRMLNEAPNRLMGQAARGDLLSNVQDVNIPDNARVRVAHFTGGVRPSALGQNARQAGAAASALSLNQLHQPNFGIPDLPSPPGLSNMPQANWLDKFLGVATPAASLAGLFANARNPAGVGFDTQRQNTLPFQLPIPGSEGPLNSTIPPPQPLIPGQEGPWDPFISFRQTIPTRRWIFPGGQGGY